MTKKTASQGEYNILHNEQGWWWGFGHRKDDPFFERTSEVYFPDEQSCQRAIDEDSEVKTQT